MSCILRSRDNFLKDTYARVGVIWDPGMIESPGYLCAESGWNREEMRPFSRVLWCNDIEEATRFPNEEAAWTVFDKSGHGRRADYLTEPV